MRFREGDFAPLKQRTTSDASMRVFPVLISLCCLTAAFAQSPLRLHGSTTVESALEGKREELEAKIGRRIEFNATNTTVGLASLVAGRAAVAMLSSPDRKSGV